MTSKKKQIKTTIIDKDIVLIKNMILISNNDNDNSNNILPGYLMEIFVIHNGRILPYILDPNFEKQLPVIPAQVRSHNTFPFITPADLTLLSIPILTILYRSLFPTSSKNTLIKLVLLRMKLKLGEEKLSDTFGIELRLQKELPLLETWL